jgi:hypothetical protein
LYLLQAVFLPPLLLAQKGIHQTASQLMPLLTNH